jgi:hypothetical protein
VARGARAAYACSNARRDTVAAAFRYQNYSAVTERERCSASEIVANRCVSVQVGPERKPPEDEASGSNPLGRIPLNRTRTVTYGAGFSIFRRRVRYQCRAHSRTGREMAAALAEEGVVLLGDSILDNGACTSGGPDVVKQRTAMCIRAIADVAAGVRQ